MVTLGTITHCVDADFLSQLSIPARVAATKLCPFQGTELTLQLEKTESAKPSRAEAFEIAQTILDKRLAELGPAEIALVPMPPDQFLVQLPNTVDQRQALDLITQRSHLTFRLQRPSTPELQALLTQKTQLQDQLKSNPPNSKQLEQQLAQIHRQIYRPTALTGQNVRDASYEAGVNGQYWDIALRFDDQGAEQFQEITKQVAGTQGAIGIFLDDQLISEASVGIQFAKTGITGGAAIISGNFDLETARNWASQIKAGRLPVPIKVLKTESVQTEQCDAAHSPAATDLSSIRLGVSQS